MTTNRFVRGVLLRAEFLLSPKPFRKLISVRPESKIEQFPLARFGSRTRTSSHEGSAGGTVFLRVQKFRKSRIFLEEREVFIIARVVAVFRAEFNGYLEIRHSGIGFTCEAIKSRKRVMNVVRFRRCFTRL